MRKRNNSGLVMIWVLMAIVLVAAAVTVFSTTTSTIADQSKSIYRRACEENGRKSAEAWKNANPDKADKTVELNTDKLYPPNSPLMINATK